MDFFLSFKINLWISCPLKICLVKFKNGEDSLGMVCDSTTLWRALGKIAIECHCAQVRAPLSSPLAKLQDVILGFEQIMGKRRKILLQQWVQEQS